MFSRLDAASSAGGIETVVNEIVPHIRALRPQWDVVPIAAFAPGDRFSRVPLLCDLIGGWYVWRHLRDFDATVVHGGEYLFPAAFSKRATSTIVVWHGTRYGEVPALVPRMSPAVRIYWWAERFLQQVALRIEHHIAVAPSVDGELRAAYGHAPRMALALNGAPVVASEAGLRDDREHRTAVWVGTNAHKKGLDIALAAARQARLSMPDFELIVFGIARPGDDRQEGVRWMGTAAHADVVRAIARSGVFLATTRYEACSMAVLEALAAGATVVGSPAVAWMLDGAGTTVADGRPKSYARALVATFERPDAPQERKAAAAAVLARFSWPDAARAYVREIERVLGVTLQEAGATGAYSR